VSEIGIIFVVSLVAVALLALLARKLKIAYPILLVFGGLLLSLTPGLPRVEINPEFIFLFFLPPLLFPAAIFTSWRDFRANLQSISLLAIGLVLFTTIVVGCLAHYFIGLPLAAGFVLGAIVSPPDAVAATAIAHRLKLPHHIVAILEGESLVNDATALVAYRFAIASLASGSFSLVNAGGQFIIVAAGGVLVGVGVGWLAAWFHNHVDDVPVEITASFLTPFIAYLLAERLHLSGVLAVVSAGMFLGWRLPEITNSKTRLQGGPFWNMIEFLLNGFVFILIGLKLPDALKTLAGHPIQQLIGQALLISLAVILVRIIWVFSATYLPRLLFGRIRKCKPAPDWKNVTIVAWTGMRGVVSLAAALAVPLTVQKGALFPGRDLILFLTFVVIFATLVVQGLSLPFLIRWLRLSEDKTVENEERTARIKANQAALERLKQIVNRDPSRTEASRRLEIEYEDRLEQLRAKNETDSTDRGQVFSTAYDELSQETLIVERQTILELRNQNIINDEVLRDIQRDLDFEESRLRHQR
jgi:Na+/H+ antiporter